MDFKEAWIFCNESLFFSRPIGKTRKIQETDIVKVYWENEMKKLIQIDPCFEEGVKHEWEVELTIWNPQDKHEYSFDEFYAETFEDAIIKTALLVKEKIGTEKLSDFYITDKKNPPILNGTLNEKNRSRYNDEKIREVMKKKFDLIKRGAGE